MIEVSLEAGVVERFGFHSVEVFLRYGAPPHNSRIVVGTVPLNRDYLRGGREDNDVALEILAEGLSKLWRDDE